MRWVQVPVSSLRAQPRRSEPDVALGLPLDHARFFPFPMTAARGVRLVSSLVNAVGVAQGEVVARAHVRLASGRGEFSFPLRAGMETAEWSWDRPDVRPASGISGPRRRRAGRWRRRTLPAFSGHHYLAELALPGTYFVDGLRLEPAAGAGPPAGDAGGAGGRRRTARCRYRAAGLYVSDARRLREASATPTVRLFEVARTIGPARVAAALRTLPDDRAVLEALAQPERFGVDPLRDALATAADAAGAAVPPEARASRAEIVTRSASRLDVRAEGPGVLVLADSYDAGWSARLDGAPARPLRVNHARAGRGAARRPPPAAAALPPPRLGMGPRPLRAGRAGRGGGVLAGRAAAAKVDPPRARVLACAFYRFARGAHVRRGIPIQ